MAELANSAQLCGKSWLGVNSGVIIGLPYLVHHYRIWIEATTKPNNGGDCDARSCAAFMIHHASRPNKHRAFHSLICQMRMIFHCEECPTTHLVARTLFSGPWYFQHSASTSMQFLNAVGAHTCHLCTIPLPHFSNLLVCSRGACTHLYIVSMEFFQSALVIF